MASSLAQSGIDNGAYRSFGISLAGHLVLAASLLFLPSPKKKIFVEEVPRSVKLIAHIEKTAPPRPEVVRKPKPRPKVSPPPPARKPPPRPAPPSKIAVPSKTAPPPVKPREAEPPSATLQEKLARRIAKLEPAVEQAPELALPEIAPLPVPDLPPVVTHVDKDQDLVPLSAFPYSWYTALVKERVYAQWKPPSSFILGGKKIAAIASFRILRDGGITRIELSESSGHRLFDQSSLAALTTLDGLPALPTEFKEDHLDVVIRFQNPNR